jgi:hypothetical protein
LAGRRWDTACEGEATVAATGSIIAVIIRAHIPKNPNGCSPIVPGPFPLRCAHMIVAVQAPAATTSRGTEGVRVRDREVATNPAPSAAVLVMAPHPELGIPNALVKTVGHQVEQLVRAVDCVDPTGIRGVGVE